MGVFGNFLELNIGKNCIYIWLSLNMLSSLIPKCSVFWCQFAGLKSVLFRLRISSSRLTLFWSFQEIEYIYFFGICKVFVELISKDFSILITIQLRIFPRLNSNISPDFSVKWILHVLPREYVYLIFISFEAQYRYSRLSPNVHLYKTHTSVKRTPRVGPCFCLFPLFDSLEDGHLFKTNT